MCTPSLAVKNITIFRYFSRAMVDEHISLWPYEMVDAQSVDNLNSALTYAIIKKAERLED